MKLQKQKTSQLLFSAITLGVLRLAGSAQAQESAQRVEVTGSSIKRLASEDALPITTVKASEFAERGITTMADLMMILL